MFQAHEGRRHGDGVGRRETLDNRRASEAANRDLRQEIDRLSIFRQLAYRDDLTGLYNRRLFTQVEESEVRRRLVEKRLDGKELGRETVAREVAVRDRLLVSLSGMDDGYPVRLAALVPVEHFEQGRRANAQHSKGFAEGKTCIDCHKGIAHTLPAIEIGRAHV